MFLVVTSNIKSQADKFTFVWGHYKKSENVWVISTSKGNI